MERPGLQRLLADMDAGKVDVIVVYKIDRLSRALLDFMKMIERFNEKGISFVSVTQHFNTTDPTGRMELPRFSGQFMAVVPSPEVGDSRWTYSLLPIR